MEAKNENEIPTKIPGDTNDVLSPDFESKLDPMFRSDWQPKKPPIRERKRVFNSRLLGVGMMPPDWRHRKEEDHAETPAEKR